MLPCFKHLADAFTLLGTTQRLKRNISQWPGSQAILIRLKRDWVWVWVTFFINHPKTCLLHTPNPHESSAPHCSSPITSFDPPLDEGKAGPPTEDVAVKAKNSRILHPCLLQNGTICFRPDVPVASLASFPI